MKGFPDLVTGHSGPSTPPFLFFSFLSFFFFFFCFLGSHSRHIEVPSLGAESELLLPTYTTATATQDPSRVCNLHHSSWPLIEARDQTRILIDTSRIRLRSATAGTPFFQGVSFTPEQVLTYWKKLGCGWWADLAISLSKIVILNKILFCGTSPENV